MTAIVAGAVLASTSVIVAVAASVLASDARALEERAADENMRRVEEQIAADLLDLGATAREFSDIGQVVMAGAGLGDGNETLALGLSLFAGGRVEALFMWFDEPIPLPDGGALSSFGVALDRANAEFTEPGPELSAKVANATFLEEASLLSPAAGLLAFEDKVYGAASYPMMSFIPGQPGAKMALLRPYDASFIAGLSDVTGARVSLRPVTADEGTGLSVDESTYDRRGSDAMRVERTLAGGDGAPAMTIVLDDDRAIHRNGMTSIIWLVVASFTGSAVLIAVVVAVLRVSVTGRLSSLTRRVQTIAQDPRPGMRTQVDGVDEIGALGQSFDGLLATLDMKSDELERKNTELERFASLVAHDLKSPLSTFRLNTALVRRAAATIEDPLFVEAVARMERGAIEMDGRIEHVLTYARSGGRALDRHQIDLGDLAEAVRTDLAADIEAAGAVVRIDRLPVVHGDPSMLSIAFQNLVANAIKFGRPGTPPRVRVWGEQRGRRVRVHVRDNGRGFSQDQAAGLTEPFARLRNADGVQGKGLGLATVRRIVERHGGRLIARGRPERGAWFTVELPS